MKHRALRCAVFCCLIKARLGPPHRNCKSLLVFQFAATMLAGIALSTAIALVGLTSRTDAHGYLKQPEPSWVDSPNVEWVVNIDNFWDIGSGGDQVGTFKTMAAEKGMSVKDVVLDMVKDKTCGNTKPDGAAQPIPSDGLVKWLGNDGGGFTHTGPCEIYLDDKMVLHSDDCEDEFPGGPNDSGVTSDMPIDYSSCNGKCTLTIYWLAFQNAQWQAYVNCVPLEGSGGAAPAAETPSSAAGSSAEQQQATDAPAPAAPSTSTAGSSSAPAPSAPSTGGSSTEEQSTEAPAPATESSTAGSSSAPAPAAPSTGGSSIEEQATEAPPAETQTTEAPAAETQDTKCNAPARRLRKKLSAI